MNTDLIDFELKSREKHNIRFSIPDCLIFSLCICEDPSRSVSMKISSKKANHLKGWDAKPLT